MNKVNPFTWGYDEFDRFESIPNQFNATYKDCLLYTSRCV